MDTAAAKKRCEAADKGPWLIQKERDKSAPQGVIYAYDAEAEGYYSIATVHEPGDANLEFITHARTDLPAALEEIEITEQDLGRERAYTSDLEAALACDSCKHPLNHIEHLAHARAAALEAVELLKRERDEARQERRSP